MVLNQSVAREGPFHVGGQDATVGAEFQRSIDTMCVNQIFIIAKCVGSGLVVQWQ